METIEEFYLAQLRQVLLGKCTLDDVEAACMARLSTRTQRQRDEDQARLRNAVGRTAQQCTRVLDRFLTAQQRTER